MKFMKEDHEGANLNPAHISTALEYQRASKEENRASHQIDAGREPYLVNIDAFEMGVHPYVEVWDVAIGLDRGEVILVTGANDYTVSPDTVLVWR